MNNACDTSASNNSSTTTITDLEDENPLFITANCDSFEEYLDRLVEEQTELAVLEASLSSADGLTHEICSSSARKSNENTSWLRRILSSIKKREFNMTRLLAFTLFLWSLIHFALLFNRSYSIIREALPPSPFFRHTNSAVKDFYGGNLQPELLMSNAELTIVMLYAPWDNRSKQFRHSFVEVANAFQHLNSVKFVAVNCHYHRGQCRHIYKLLFFPVIFAYTSYKHPIVFNQVFSSDRLFSWVLHLMNPLQRIHSATEFRNSIRSVDFLVLGHFAIELPRPLPRAYTVFLNAALKAADFRSSIKFSVVLNRSLAFNEIGFTDTNSVHFYTIYNGNELDQSVAFLNIDQQTKSHNVINWINQCIERFSSKAVNYLELEDLETGGKSEALFNHLNNTHATLVLFTSQLGLPSQSRSEIALKSFAKLFHHCPNGSGAGQSMPPQFEATSYGQFFSKTRKICSIKDDQLKSCCAQFIKSEKYKKKAVEYTNDIEDEAKEENECDKIDKILPNGHLKHHCCTKQQRKNNSTASVDIPGIGWSQRMWCKLIRLIRTNHTDLHHLITPSTDSDHQINSMPLEFDSSPRKWLIGAGCRMNRTLGFLTMDERFGRHFMHKWGNQKMDLGRDEVAIVDREDERIFWMDTGGDGIEWTTLANFVDGYFNNTLDWIPKNQKIHKFDEVKPSEEYDDDEWYPPSVLARLNRTGFLTEILNSNRSYDAVIFFSGGDWHGPSSSVLHFFHHTQHFFNEFDKFIRFYIIDVSQNALPWKFHFDYLPAVAFFPARSNRESFTFRSGLAHSVPNLLGFILPRCQLRLRWLLAFTACRGVCLERNERKIEQIVAKTRGDIRTLRGMLRRKRGWGQAQIGHGVHHHFLVLLRRRQQQKAVLLRLLGHVKSLQLGDGGDGENLRRMAEEAAFAGWMLSAKYGLRFNIA